MDGKITIIKLLVLPKFIYRFQWNLTKNLSSKWVCGNWMDRFYQHGRGGIELFSMISPNHNKNSYVMINSLMNTLVHISLYS